MGKRSLFRLCAVVAVLTVVATTGVAFAWVRRTSPPWPAVAGTAYEIPLGPDGCPVIGDRYQFVDAPGPLAPPGAIEVLLCVTPTGLLPPGPEDPPRQRVLGAGADDVVARLNRLPDRNQAWRKWQRKHSGWWPDPAPASIGEVCPEIGYSHDYSFVLRYADRPPVPLIYTCGGQAGGLTSGTRTRTDYTKPHLVEEFLSRFQRQ